MKIVFVLFEGAQSLDLTGPLECFSTARRLVERRGERAPYEHLVAAETSALLRCSSGLQIVPDVALADVAACDTLLVVGGEGTRRAVVSEELLGEVRRLASGARRVVSVCTGAFVLAAAGLLDGRRATTHWNWCEQLASTFPAVRLEPDRIFVRDGKVASSAGVTAGIDLALALIEEDLGREVALTVARLLVVYLKRPGGQAQFSTTLAAQLRSRGGLAEIVTYVEAHPSAELTVAALARRAAMSRRHFVRRFTAEVGVSPARFVTRVRVEAARRWLENGELGLDEVAAASGFSSAETLRRAFHRIVGVAPSHYRLRFAS